MWLADHKFIALTKRPGRTPAIQLLNPLGTGDPMSDPRHPRPYMSIPLGFWSKGWLLELPPVAIAVLFALRERLGGYTQPRYLLPDRRESYGLSHGTWTRGSRELEGNGVLTVSTITQGEEYAYTRRRRNYRLNMDLLGTVPPHDGIGKCRAVTSGIMRSSSRSILALGTLTCRPPPAARRHT